jgi:hypothetical protein
VGGDLTKCQPVANITKFCIIYATSGIFPHYFN